MPVRVVSKLDDDVAAKRVGQVAELLERNGINPSDIGRIRQVNLWQQGYKDDDGEGQVQDLVGVQLSPAWEEGPAWPLIDRAKPVKVAKERAKKTDTGIRTVAFIPDPQIGAHIVGDASQPDSIEIHPMQDEDALRVAVNMVADAQPDDIVFLGDWVDFADFSLKFARTPSMAHAGQYTIDQGHYWLAQFVAAAPNANATFLAGNHEARLGNLVVANAQAAWGLRKATEPPDSWPAMSVPYLLDTDSLGITYMPGYPANEVWLRDDIRAIHGLKLSAKAQAQATNSTVSTFFGHLHRLEAQTRTFRSDRGEAKHSISVSCGTLARIDGAVPSFHSATDERGRPVNVTEDWQQGLVFASFETGTRDLPQVELVPITDGSAVHRGKRYSAT